MGQWNSIDMALLYGHWRLERLEYVKAQLEAKHKR